SLVPDFVASQPELETDILHPNYAAPEVLDGERAAPASDIYSLGRVILKTLTPATPDQSERDESLRKLFSEMASNVPEERPQNANAVLERLASLGKSEAGFVRTAGGQFLLAPEQQINDAYRVIRRLGPARTRTAYLCEHIVSRTPRLLRVSLPTPNLLDRLRAAYRRHYALRHEGIIRINELETVRTPNSDLHMVFCDFEHVDGVSLEEASKDGLLSMDEVLSATRKLCDLLVYLEQVGAAVDGIDRSTILRSEGGRIVVIRPVGDFPESVIGPPPMRYHDPDVKGGNERDLRALMMLAWELATGNHPYPDGIVSSKSEPKLGFPKVRDSKLMRGLREVVSSVLGGRIASAREVKQRLDAL
ncbi:MAG: hypothetical protein KC561_17300, partial [Myxococcales bacterium]|nr:hypothetical protein [Myxococcales bacterium]